MAAAPKKKKQVDKVTIPLKWHFPDNVPTLRATNAIIEIHGDEFVLSFFEERGPVLATQEDRDKAMELESIKALCVARISLSPGRMERVATIFSQQYDSYVESKNNAAKSPAK